MTRASTGIGRIGQLKLFVASLWLTLATALFCALAPAELPAGAAHGSAFNPANNVVAVHSGVGINRALLRRIAEGDPAGTSEGGGVFLPSEPARVAIPDAVPILAAVAAPATLALSHRWNPHYARGPPVA